MKSYENWSAEDFACDDDFLLWVKHPDLYPELNILWKNWLKENPHKKEVLEEARLMVLAVVSEKQYHAPSERKKEIWRRISNKARLSVDGRVLWWQSWYSRAAAVIIFLFVGWFSFRVSPVEEHTPAGGLSPRKFIEHVNNSPSSKTIILGDGTTIILQPQSMLEYPEVFHADRREVRLTGQAFFDVSRDPSRPFLVHAEDIVTRVLGTSFTVRNVKGEDNVLVQVKTGKVSVFRASSKAEPSDNTVDGVVLMPNQQVVYERAEMKMTKSLVENPSVLVPEKAQEFEFVDAPIREVFAAIEEAYGVDIVFDEDALSSCYLNASLTEVDLYDKLKLICKGINTTYEIMDSHIIIYGKGCQEEISNPNENQPMVNAP